MRFLPTKSTMRGFVPLCSLLLVAALLAPPAWADEATPEPTPTPEPTSSEACVVGAPDGYERVVDLTFPVRGDVTFIDDYHHIRGGGTRRHQGTDLMGPKLLTLHAALGGVVEIATGIDETVPTWGYYLRIRHDDGTAAAYVHLNNDTPGSDDGRGGPGWAYAPGIRKGARVERGQWLGYLGDSGNAEDTAPHLHFELHDPELDDPCLADDVYRKDRLNPYPSLLEAVERGDYPPAPPVATVRRLAGPTRVETAVAISRERPSAATVIVVPEGSHAEALVAAPLAGLVEGPVLLSARDRLSDDVAEEVRRLGARNAYVIGRVDQLAERVEDDLRDAGVRDLARLAEPDPFALSAAMAREIASYDPDRRFPRVLLALGEHADEHRAWPDALSAGALAAALQVPVLLTRGGELPEPVRAVLEELEPEFVQLVGGTAAIDESVADDAADAADARVERLAGENRFATSVAVAEEAVEVGLDGPRAWTATGHAFPDALAAGPAAARSGSPLLLLDGRRPGGAPDAEAWLVEAAERIHEATVVGGTAAITEDVRNHLAKLLGG